jgi:hypothetical protein
MTEILYSDLRARREALCMTVVQVADAAGVCEMTVRNNEHSPARLAGAIAACLDRLERAAAEERRVSRQQALTRSDAVARGAPPPRHRGPDGSPRGMGWIAFAGAAALGLLWVVFQTVSTFLEVLP